MECAREMKIIELEKRIEGLERENNILKKENIKLKNLQTSIQRIFTPGQIQKLRNPDKIINWTLDDISSSTFCILPDLVHRAGLLREWARMRMIIKYDYEYDLANDAMLKLSNYVQVGMVRGLLAKLKQLIGAFDMTKR